MFTHRHADGGIYRFICEANGKAPQKGYEGDWMPGVVYEGTDGKKRWTTIERWHNRFEELPASSKFPPSTVEVEWDDGFICAFSFSLVEVNDVRHLIVTANTGAAKPYVGSIPDQVKRVLMSQAEMVSLGLHVRDSEFEDLMGDVNAFHVKFKQIDDDSYGIPRVLPADLFDFRVKFHDEETDEYADEQLRLGDAYDREDHREIVNSLELQLDALCDAVWVLLGTADLQFGKKIFREAWKRVVKANMAKVLATEDPNAKDSGRDVRFDIRKPEGWVPPDHRDLVQDYLRRTRVPDPGEHGGPDGYATDG